MPKFGTYSVVAKIGLGGFGVVYEGFDPRIGRRVAIKTCSSDRPDIRARFMQEARIAGNLDHRNIVVVYDYGEETGVPYLVQELLAGEDLDKRIARDGGKLPLETKVDWLIQVALGLDYAHRRGVVHRDIKPSNVRVVTDDQVKILDFGIAKLAEGDAGLTRSGETIGTPCYLAPEQIRGGTIDQRCDVYAFGILAHELLSGTRAFPGDRPARVLFMVINDEPRSLEELTPEVPRRLAEIVRKCHAKQAELRYASIEEVIGALSAVALDLRTDLQTEQHQTEQQRSSMTPPRPAVTPAAAPPMVGGMSRSTSDPKLRRSWRDITRVAKTRSTWRRSVLVVFVLLIVVFGSLLAWTVIDPTLAERRPWIGPIAKLTAGLSDAARTTVPVDVQGSHSNQSGEEAGGGVSASLSSPSVAAPNLREDSATATPGGSPGADAGATVQQTTITIPAAWSPQITVQVDDRAPVPLDRERTLELSPGAHRLTYRLASDRYRDEVVRSIDLVAGQRKTLDVPLRRPGALTLQTPVGTPQLRAAFADGAVIGTTPLDLVLLRPGKHRLVLSAIDSDRDNEALATQLDVVIRSEEALLITTTLEVDKAILVSRPFREGG